MGKSGWRYLSKLFNNLTTLFGEWLDGLDEQAKYLHLFMLMGVLVMLLSVAGCHYHLSHDIDHYETNNLTLARAIVTHKQKLETFRLQEKIYTETHARLHSLKILQNKSRSTETVLLELAGITPPYVRISRLILQGDSIKLTGEAKLNPEIAVFLEHLSDNTLFRDPVLLSLKQSPPKSEHTEDFEIAVQWRKPLEEEAG